MKAELRASWTAALRSGEYEQGQGLLRYTDTAADVKFHCCLGVLCDITPGVGWQEGRDTGGDRPVLANGESIGYATLSEPEDFGLPSDIADELAGLNDGGKSFSDIADYIEKNVPVDG